MSKMDGLRAMREARYAEAQARSSKAAPAGAGRAKAAPSKVAPARAAQAQPPVAPPATPSATPSPDAAEVPATTEDELCGHRNMGGRTCTREKGHSAKSHRYS